VSSVITWIPAFAGTTMRLRLHRIFQRIGWLQEDAIALRKGAFWLTILKEI
jgi:hypothetical protein